MNDDAILALDAGTSSSRAARFDASGHRVEGSLVQRPGTLRTGGDGEATLDPAAWRATMEAVIRRAATGRLRAVGMSCFWHSFLGVDARGNALTPIYTWADSRCREDAAALRRELDERAVHAETGCMLRASFWPAKMRWLRRTEPALFRRVKKWVSPAEWLQWRMTGSATCALGMATGTGLFDPTKQTWSERMLAVAGLDADQLLPISDEPTEWRGAPWFPGIGDGAASNLGGGATEPGFAAINVGTSAALRVMRSGDRVRAPFGLFGYRVDAKRFLIGGAVSNAGNLFAWARRELCLPPDIAALERALAKRPTPGHGLTVLPFWTAERAPRWNEEAAGTILGLRQSTTAIDILQAMMEAFYFRLAEIADRTPGASTWIVSGGGIKSRPARQRLANVLGRPIRLGEEPEASLRGAAVAALEKLGERPPRTRLGAAVEPQPAAVEAYRQARLAQRRLERRLDGFTA